MLRLLLCKSVLDGNILSLNPSKLEQFLAERVQEDRDTRSSAWIQETYAEDFPRLLRLGRKAKCQEQSAKSKAKYFSPCCLVPHTYIHLITLSALASTLGGIVRPICFAVFR